MMNERIEHKAKPILLLGVGNIVQQDDGVGVHAITELMKREWPEEVELYDGGTLGIDLLPIIQNRDTIIVIDAVNGGESPGTLFKFSPDEVTLKVQPYDSLHQLGFLETVSMAQILGTEPNHVLVIGCQPNVVDWGLELTETISGKIARILEIATEEAEVALQRFRNKSRKNIQVEG